MHRQQIEDSVETICYADSECEDDTRVSLKRREDRVSVLERESRIIQQCEVHAKCETRVLTDPKREASILSVPECEACVSTKCEGHVLTQREVRVSTRKCETRFQPKNPYP